MNQTMSYGMKTEKTRPMTQDEIQRKESHYEDAKKTSFRKQEDGWKILGPSDYIGQAKDNSGAYLDVTKKNGETSTVYVISVSKEFDIDGQSYRYGYIR